MAPSVGRSREQPFLGRRSSRSGQNRVDEDNVVLIEEESDNLDDVVVIDIPDSTPKSDRLKRDKKAVTSWTGVICLDDDDDDESDGDRVMNGGNFKNGNVGSSSAANQENVSPLKLSKGKRTYSGKNTTGSRFGIYDIDDLSGDDIADCVLMDDNCGSVKEMWEKAYTKRKWDSRYVQPAQGDPKKDTNNPRDNVKTSTDCGPREEPSSVAKPSEGGGESSSIHKKKGNLDYTADDPLSDSTDKGVEEIFIDSMLNIHFSNGSEPGTSSKRKGKKQVKHANNYTHDTAEVPISDSRSSRSKSCAKENVSASHQHTPKNSVSIDETTIPNNPNPHNDETNDVVRGEEDEFVMVGDREKLKETDEYKKAAEEEQASRQRALQIQSEEAQNLRRARKRMKAETMRIEDMEKRQKQRLDEIRETEKKDQENSNMRDVIRAEVRKNLSVVENACFDMASVLRALGIPVNEVRVAYKKALLKFHPDRASRSDIRQQVEAEEKFKLIARMKEKYMPSL